MDSPIKPSLLQRSILPGSTRTDGNEADSKSTKSSKVEPDDSEKPESTEVSQREDIPDQSSTQDSDSDSDIEINQSPIEETPKVILDTDRNRRLTKVRDHETSSEKLPRNEEARMVNLGTDKRPAAVKDKKTKVENPPRIIETAIVHRDFGQSPTNVKDHSTTTVKPPRNEETPKDNPHRNRRSREVLQDETDIDQHRTDDQDSDISVVIKQRSTKVNQLEDVTGQSSTEDPDNDFEIDQRPAVKNIKTRDEDPPRNEETAVVNLDIGQSPTYVKDQCTRSEKPPRNEATPKDNPDRNQRAPEFNHNDCEIDCEEPLIQCEVTSPATSDSEQRAPEFNDCEIDCEEPLIQCEETSPATSDSEQRWITCKNLLAIFIFAGLAVGAVVGFSIVFFRDVGNQSVNNTVNNDENQKSVKIELELIVIDITGTEAYAQLELIEDKKFGPHHGNATIHGNHILHFRSIESTDLKKGVNIRPSEIDIEIEGDYYVYVSTYFDLGSHSECRELTKQIWTAAVIRIKRDYTEEIICQAEFTCCDNCSTNSAVTYASGRAHLSEGDRLKVNVSGYGIIHFEKRSTFFGLAMVDQDKKQGKKKLINFGNITSSTQLNASTSFRISDTILEEKISNTGINRVHVRVDLSAFCSAVSRASPQPTWNIYVNRTTGNDGSSKIILNRSLTCHNIIETSGIFDLQVDDKIQAYISGKGLDYE